MITLTLSLTETQALMGILEEAIEDLRSEIVDTDSQEYKDMLKARKEIFKKILQSLQQAEQAQATPVTSCYP
jgi:predicted XRE-type DNA-binding protein